MGESGRIATRLPLKPHPSVQLFREVFEKKLAIKG